MAGQSAGAQMFPLASANAEQSVDGFTDFIRKAGQITDVVGNAIGNIAPIFAGNNRPGQGNNPTYVGPASGPTTATQTQNVLTAYMPLLIIAGLGVGAYFIFRKG